MAPCKALPVHLLVRVLQHLGTEESYKEAAVMHLVSKDWMQAFSESPGHLCRHKSQQWSDDSDIGLFCALAPSMSSLEISSKQAPLILQPLAACTQLKGVKSVAWALLRARTSTSATPSLWM